MPHTTPHLPGTALPPLLIDVGCVVLGAAGIALLLTHLAADGSAQAPTLLALAAGLLALLCLLLAVRNRQRAGALQRAHQALEHAQAIAHVGSWQLRGERMYWSDETCRIFGLAPGQSPRTADFLDHVHPDDRDRVAAVLAAATAGQAVDLEHRIVVDGDTRWVHVRAEPMLPPDASMTGTVQDVTAPRAAEEALCRSRQRLRALGAHHERLVEEERAHIAREIHDELGQYLTTLRLDAAMLEMSLAQDNPRLAQRLNGMKGLIDETIQSVRRVASTLRPTALDLGLDSGIEWLVDDFQERNTISCALRLDERGLPEVDDARATLVFRILQEALTNVVRHAEARTVQVSVDLHAGALRLQVHDDGRGFDPCALRERKTFGLLGMHERAMVFGGSLHIDSAPGRGTTVRLEVPLEDTPMQREEFPEICEGCPLMEAAIERPETGA